jgi:chemotaxis response regulator CheB
VSSRDYLIKREQQELEAALTATGVEARRRHLEMAAAYTSRIEQTKRQEQIPAVTASADGPGALRWQSTTEGPSTLRLSPTVPVEH